MNAIIRKNQKRYIVFDVVPGAGLEPAQLKATGF